MSEKYEQEHPPPYYDDPQKGGPPKDEGYPPQYGGYPPQQPGYTGYPPAPGYAPPQGMVMHQPGPGQTTVIVTGPVANPPSDHLAFNIFVTICCCWPIGIFAILKSVETRDMINRGDSTGATNASKKAKKYGCCALGFGIASVILSIVIIAVYIGLLIG